MKPDKFKKIEQTTTQGGEFVNMEHEEIMSLPMKGSVQQPYNQPYDRHPLPDTIKDQTDRAAIGRYSRAGIDVWLQKKLSGREYSWSIFNEKGNRIYSDVYIDRENKGQEFAISMLMPQIEATIDFLTA